MVHFKSNQSRDAIMKLDPINKFFLKLSGTTGKAIKYAVRNNDQLTPGAAFFQPYKSVEDVALKSQAIFTAPLWLAVIALETFIASIGLAIKSMVDFYATGEEEAKATITMSGIFLLTALCTTLSAFLSPLVNLIDCIGSLVTRGPLNNTPDISSTISIQF